MAAFGRTAVGNAEFFGQVRARHPQAVVEPVVDAHVGAAGHVALDTEIPFTGFALVRFFMKMMRFRVIPLCPVTLGTQIVLFFVQLEAMHIVTVAAAHTVPVHFALDKGAVNVDFFQDLTVRIVEPIA